MERVKRLEQRKEAVPEREWCENGRMGMGAEKLYNGITVNIMKFMTILNYR